MMITVRTFSMFYSVTQGRFIKRFFFLEICKSYQLTQKGILLEKDHCVGNSSNGFKRDWEKRKKLEDFRDLLLEEQVSKLFQQEEDFWVAMNNVLVN